MTYKLPEPVAWRFFYGAHGWPTFNSAEYVREYMPGQTKDGGLFTADQMQAAYAAGQRDMLERCIEVITRYNDCSDAYEELKELLNEQH